VSEKREITGTSQFRFTHDKVSTAHRMTTEAAKLEKEKVRQRLRANIRGKRCKPDVVERCQLKQDPMGALLRMGVDDAALLRNATDIVARPAAALATAKALCEELPKRGEPLDDSFEDSLEEAPPLFV